VGLAALLVVASSPAQAAFVVGGENGWQMSFDGMINIFAVYTMQGNLTDNNGNVLVSQASQSFRDRTGLLPSIFAFNVKSPTINGVDYGARIGLYPQVQNNGSRTGFGPDTLSSASLTSSGLNTGLGGGSRIDIREVFFTADSCWGQILAGRALNLFEGQNILTDMTLMSVGVPLDLTGAGTTLGHIGYGYSFPSFGSQFRYTTPDYKGFKWAFSINDPSQIRDANLSVNAAGIATTGAATKLNQPAFMTEFSYATAFPNGKLHAWADGMFQEASYASTHHKVSTIGGAGGVDANFGPVGVMVSGFGGKALGLTLTQDDIEFVTGAAPLDAVQKERVSYGGLAQVTYTIGKVKLGANYGINYMDRTDHDIAVTNTSAIPIKKSQQAATGAVFYSVNKYLQVVGEYTWARDSWYTASARSDKNIISLGTVFVW
jgi:hypothetical protein